MANFSSADPSNPLVQQALSYQGLNAVPSNWAMDSQGRLVARNSPNSLIGVAAPFSTQSSLLGEIGHASPYIGAAFGMGALGGLGAGGAGSTSGLTSGAGASTGAAAGAAGGSGGGMAGGDFVSSLLGGAGKNILTNLGTGYLSNVLGGAASGLASQQGQQANLAGAKAGAAQSQYQDALNAALMKGLALPQQGASMARAGDLLANVQDVTPQFTPGMGYSFSGGLRPSALGPNARQAGQNLSNAGLAAQSMQLPATPDLTSGFPSSTPGGLQQALQYGALGTGILGAMNPQQSPMQQLLQYLMKQGGQQNQTPTSSDGSTVDDNS